MRFIKTNGATLHAEHRPAKPGAPTIVFSNSLGTDFRIWDGLLAELPDGWGTIRYDTRGHGLSSLAPAEKVAPHAADIAAVADAFGVDKLVVCGLSVGGLIALKFAVDFPARLDALVLCCTGARIGNRHDWEARIATVRSEGLPAIRDSAMERWFSPGFRKHQGDVVTGVSAMFERQPVAGYASLCALLRDTDITGEIGAIEAPTLAVAGTIDPATPPELLQATAAAVADGTYVGIEGVSHMPCIERPAELAGEIGAFLAEKGVTGG